MPVYELEIFTDYFQFYLQDEQVTDDLSQSWTPEALKRKLVCKPGLVGVGTVSNMPVPVRVEVLVAPPAAASPDAWEQINECSLHVPSGRVVIAGVSDYLPKAQRLEVTPGWHRLRIGYGGLNTISADGLDGNDHYHIWLWPAPEAALHVVK